MSYETLDNEILLTTTTLSLNLNESILPFIFNERIKEIDLNNDDFLVNIIYNLDTKKSTEKSILSNKSKKIIKEGTKGIFYNCLLIKIVNKKTNFNYSIKIFKNGSVIITGIKDKITEDLILNFIVSLKNVYCQEKKQEQNNIKNMKYVMINGKIKVSPINLRTLKIQLENCCEVKYSSYNPENYKGLIIKTHNLGTIIVFGTGSTILSSNSFDNLNKLRNIIKTVTM